MWISRVHLERFGILQNLTVTGLAPGLNVLFGPNESGKTTLMMFLRAMFFGFAAANKTIYNPVDGAEPAGNLELVDDQGRGWRLERRGRGRRASLKITGPEGGYQDEARLAKWLHQVRQPVYENIYAFGLTELMRLDALQQREVKHLLYSASLGLGRISLAAVEASLQKHLDELFKPRAAKPEINRVLAELEQVRAQIRQLEHQPEEYARLQQARQELTGEVAGLTQESARLTAESRWLEKLRRAWEVWQDWRQAQQELAQLPVVEQFPQDGLARLEKTLEALVEVEGQLARWRGEWAQLAESQPQAPDSGLMEQSGAIQALWEERLLYREKLEDLRRQETALTVAATHLKESQERLGAGWDEAALAEFTPSVAWEAELAAWPQRLDEATSGAPAANQQWHRGQDALQDLEDEFRRTLRRGMWAGGDGIYFFIFAGVGLIAALAAYLVYSRAPAQNILMAMLGGVAGMACLAALVHALLLRRMHHHRLAALDGSIQEAQAALTAAEEAAKQARQCQSDILEDWRRFLQQWFPDQDLSPFGVQETYREAVKAREHLRVREDARAMVQALQRYLTDFRTRLALVLEHLDRPGALTEDVLPILEPLRAELQEALDHQQRHRQWSQKLQEVESHLREWQANQQRLQAVMHDLFTHADVAEEEAFRRLAATVQSQRDLRHKSGQLLAQLRLAAGGDAALEKLQQDLEKLSPDDLEEKTRRCQERLADSQASLEAAQRRLWETEERLKQLERADDLSHALLTEQQLAARLQDAAHAWAVTILCQHFLEQGRQRFEAESQPQVLKRASQYFDLLTQGRYRQVVATLEGENFLVINRQGAHIKVEHLSRGAAEQLYLALRFAVVQEYAQGGRRLPLILDDILVNFDHHRARQAVSLLDEMGRSHQLLLFTCHPHIVELVLGVLGPAAPQPIRLG